MKKQYINYSASHSMIRLGLQLVSFYVLILDIILLQISNQSLLILYFILLILIIAIIKTGFLLE